MEKLAPHVSRYKDDELLGLEVGHLWDAILEDDRVAELCRALVARGTAEGVSSEVLKAAGAFLARMTANIRSSCLASAVSYAVRVALAK